MTVAGIIKPEFISWRRYDRMLLSWLYSSLTPEIMGQIIGYQTSHEAWTSLVKIFSTSSKARAMQLRLEFQTTRKGTMSMMEYLLKVKTIADNLVAIGEPVLKKDQVLQILGGLGVDYNPIVASITAREDDISIHSIHSILLTHEQCLKFQNTIPKEDSISGHVVVSQMQQTRGNIRRISSNRNNYQNSRPNSAQPQSRGSLGNRNLGFK